VYSGIERSSIETDCNQQWYWKPSPYEETLMAFTWHGKQNGSDLLWESTITRYYFVCGQEIDVQYPHGMKREMNIGTRRKITKAQAHSFFKKGYFEYRTQSWNGTRWVPTDIPIANGTIEKEIEHRNLRQLEAQPEDVQPPKRKKK
jgi:hypothetical protein